eukprot:scaffold25496_cov130-Isochrysis_galbana.AAC.15
MSTVEHSCDGRAIKPLLPEADIPQRLNRQGRRRTSRAFDRHQTGLGWCVAYTQQSHRQDLCGGQSRTHL